MVSPLKVRALSEESTEGFRDGCKLMNSELWPLMLGSTQLMQLYMVF